MRLRRRWFIGHPGQEPARKAKARFPVSIIFSRSGGREWRGILPRTGSVERFSAALTVEGVTPDCGARRDQV
jgi:hypothetical protein